MARIDVIMPQMGESIAEGTISRWMKKVGDPIKRDEPIFEISTDKVDAEIPAPTAGTLAEILVQEGQTVAVQAIVARIETEAGAVAVAAAAAPGACRARSSAGSRRPRPRPRRRPSRGRAGTGEDPAPLRATGRAAALQRRAETLEERLRRRSTPLVRKIAAEHGLDISDHRRQRHGGSRHQERRARLHRALRPRPRRHRPWHRSSRRRRLRRRARRRSASRRAIPRPIRGKATGSSHGRASGSSPPST